ncbi:MULTISPECIES: hypothetical protein [unclassified Bartonella]|uniref:hypothetical protein n=1 Tax=unclassified Bartonella TaxID=2645622 RepID=UPI0035CEC010
MTVKKKYESTDETIEVNGVTLHRIRALRNFGDVEKGDLGGYMEHEGNLSHEGNCWVYHNAKIYDNARVYGNASVYDGAEIYDNALVGNNVKVKDKAAINGNAKIEDNAKVYGNARIFDNAEVSGNVHVFGDARVYGNSAVYENAEVYGDAKIFGDARAFGEARVSKGITSGTDWIYGGGIKYELTDETINVNGFTLYRIRALKNFGDVKKGDLGGWVESEENLSHEDDCWISGKGAVCGGLRIRGDEQVIDFQYVDNATYNKLSLLSPRQHRNSLPWYRRTWEKLLYFIGFGGK